MAQPRKEGVDFDFIIPVTKINHRNPSVVPPEHICNLRIQGTGYFFPYEEPRDQYDYNIDRVTINDQLFNLAFSKCILHIYKDTIDEAVYAHVVGLFHGGNKDEEDRTTDLKQDRPEIFGELTDQNPY